MLNKKADGGLTAIIIILIAVVFIGWLINLGNRECNSNKDCNEDYYCGSDFSCHKIPVIEKTTTINKISITGPLIIISLTLIILAIIWKWDKIFGTFGKKSSPPKKESEKEIGTPETFYTSQVQYTAK